MGCDYYTWIETVIEYTTAAGTEKYIEKGEPECHYIISDFDENPVEELEWAVIEYGKPDLFENGQWVADRDCIEALCEENKIPTNTITRVFKRKSGRLC